MNFSVVMIIPTGIGAAIGGHSGDANPAARLLASVCDTLIVHPNVVNASDLNYMAENVLYVEGSALDRLLDDTLQLKPVRSNRILVACNEINHSMDPVNAARSTYGLDVRILRLNTPLTMHGEVLDGVATGRITGMEKLITQVERYRGEFDVVAIHTPVTVDQETGAEYLSQHNKINPWGGVEAMLSRAVSRRLGLPVAHAPVEQGVFASCSLYDFPELAAEANGSHLISVLRGLSRSPRFMHQLCDGAISRDQIAALVSPVCWGEPHHLCRMAGIPIIVVSDNITSQCDQFLTEMNKKNGSHGISLVRNYYEAAGLLAAMRIGITRESVRRPLYSARILA